MHTVKVAGIGTEQPLHKNSQISIRGFQEKMEVIRHQSPLIEINVVSDRQIEHAITSNVLL